MQLFLEFKNKLIVHGALYECMVLSGTFVSDVHFNFNVSLGLLPGQDVWAVASKIKMILEKPTLQDFFNGAEVSVEVLDGCRDWLSWSASLGAVLEGGLLRDDTGNHAFIFLCRKDLPRGLQVEPARRMGGRVVALDESPLDVILLIKRHAHDANLSQPPQCILPYKMWVHFLQGHPRVPTKLRSPNEPGEMAEYWLYCAQSLLEFFPQGTMQRSIRYLQMLAAGQRGHDSDFPPLPWMYSCKGRPDVEEALEDEIHYLPVVVPALKTRVGFRPGAIRQLRGQQPPV